MGKLMIARHGQTRWNVEDKICGITDLELTEEGIRQAEELAEKVKRMQIDLIITSDMKRARKTGEIVGERLGIPVISDSRLREMNFGKYEGVSRQDAGYHRDRVHFACRYPEGGESVFQVAHRVYSCLDEWKEKYRDENVLVVAHGSACRILRTYFVDVRNEDFYHYRLQNCEIEEFIW